MKEFFPQHEGSRNSARIQKDKFPTETGESFTAFFPDLDGTQDIKELYSTLSESAKKYKNIGLRFGNSEVTGEHLEELEKFINEHQSVIKALDLQTNSKIIIYLAEKLLGKKNKALTTLRIDTDAFNNEYVLAYMQILAEAIKQDKILNTFYIQGERSNSRLSTKLCGILVEIFQKNKSLTSIRVSMDFKHNDAIKLYNTIKASNTTLTDIYINIKDVIRPVNVVNFENPLHVLHYKINYALPFRNEVIQRQTKEKDKVVEVKFRSGFVYEFMPALEEINSYYSGANKKELVLSYEPEGSSDYQHPDVTPYIMTYIKDMTNFTSIHFNEESCPTNTEMCKIFYDALLDFTHLKTLCLDNIKTNDNDHTALLNFVQTVKTIKLLNISIEQPELMQKLEDAKARNRHDFTMNLIIPRNHENNELYLLHFIHNLFDLKKQDTFASNTQNTGGWKKPISDKLYAALLNNKALATVLKDEEKTKQMFFSLKNAFSHLRLGTKNNSDATFIEDMTSFYKAMIEHWSGEEDVMSKWFNDKSIFVIDDKPRFLKALEDKSPKKERISHVSNELIRRAAEEDRTASSSTGRY